MEGTSAPPVVDLTGGHSGEAGEADLTDAGTGQKGVEFRILERSYALLFWNSIPFWKPWRATVWVTPTGAITPSIALIGITFRRVESVLKWRLPIRGVLPDPTNV